MRFRYPLQKIVDLKSSEKAQAEWLLSKSIHELNEQERSMKELLGRRREQKISFESMANECVTVAQVRFMQQHISYLDQQISRKSIEVAQAKDIVHSRMRKLTDKMLDEKKWKIAREKAQIEHEKQMLIKEQNELDEMATIRYSR